MKPETSTFFSFQKSQASHRSLLYMPLHWEQLGNVYVKFLAPKNLKGWPWPVGRLTSHSGLERYQRALRSVGKSRRPSASRYKAALTNQPEGRRRSWGCMEDHQGQEARGYAGQCSLHHSLCAFSLVILILRLMMRKSIPETIHRVETFIDFTVLREFLCYKTCAKNCCRSKRSQGLET